MITANLSLRTCLLAAGLLSVATLNAVAEENPSTLKTHSKAHFKVGTAINRSITTGRGFRRSEEQVAADIALVKAQFNQVVPENEMKWASLHPRAGMDGYDFTAADAFVAFGQANAMELAGHTLVWHSQTPGWVFEGTYLPEGATAAPAPEKPATQTAPAPPPGGGFRLQLRWPACLSRGTAGADARAHPHGGRAVQRQSQSVGRGERGDRGQRP